MHRGLYVIFTLASLTLGCDPEHHKKCEWYLMPDIDRKGRVDEGYYPVCARNFEINKQDCRLQAKEDFARSSYNKVFRYVDMTIKSPALPRTVEKIKFCD